jgi:hypothetical protein
LLPLATIIAQVVFNFGSSDAARARSLLFLVITSHVLFRLWIAMDASHTFSTSRRNGTLESLLGTPLTTSAIGDGMVAGLRQRFLWPGISLSAIAFGAALYCFGTGNSIGAMAALVPVVTTVFDISCLSWVGLWRGLATSGSTAAIVSTACRTLLLPFVWWGFLRGLFDQRSAFELIPSYFLAALINNLFFRASARTRLTEHFRILALRPFGGKLPHIESKWSPINWEEELREAGAAPVSDVGRPS